MLPPSCRNPRCGARERRSGERRREQHHDGLRPRPEDAVELDLARLRPLDRGAERVEKRVRRLEETDRLRAVVHREDDPWRNRAHELCRARAVDRRPTADRHEQHIDHGDCLALLGPQRRLAEVAEVAEADPVERQAEDRVRAAGRSRTVVVLGGDRDHLAERRLEPARGRAEHGRSPSRYLDAVVVRVLVRDEHEIGGDTVDPRVPELHSPRGEPLARLRAERVDQDGLGAREQEGGLSQPADDHGVPRSITTR